MVHTKRNFVLELLSFHVFLEFHEYIHQHDMKPVKDLVLEMDKHEAEIRRMEQEANDDREKKARFVDGTTYETPPLTIPRKIMDLGGYFFGIKS